MRMTKVFVTVVVMILLIQQARKVHDDPGYLPRLLDMITSGTSAEVK